MSNQHSYANNKPYYKSQKKFVPKSSNPVPEKPTTSNPNMLSSSIRQPSATPSIRVGSGACADRGINFVNYLPQDEAVAAGLGTGEGGSDPVESQGVVDLLNRNLSRLLKLNPGDFWSHVVRDSSLHDFLDSFLQFRSRWYDFPHRGAKGIVAGVIVGENELSRRVFMVLYRISFKKDPGAQASNSLSLEDHGVLLQEHRLLDLPKLLDICAIYGHENPDLTSQLVINALNSQLTIHDDLAALMWHFMSIVSTMHQRCTSSLKVLSASGGHEKRGSNHLLTDFLEVMDFINDAVVSMDSFVTAYKPAAVFFSCPVEMGYGNEELLSTLASIHDSLLPSLARGFRIVFSASDSVQNTSNDILPNVGLSLKMLSLRIIKFGWTLLETCYLNSEVFDSGSPLPDATKMFPANVEDAAIRADILVQTFRDINRASRVEDNLKRATFIQNVEMNSNILQKLETLRDTGWISMDNEQFSYLSGIMMHPIKTTSNNVSSASAIVSHRKLQEDENAIIMESKICQIKDLFPDYGKGFLSACLEIYDHNPEEVIQRILEGTLCTSLQSLDTTHDKISPPKILSSSCNTKDKGKGKVSEFAILPLTNSTEVVTRLPIPGPSPPLSTLSGRFVRKSKIDVPESNILNSRDEIGAQKTAALVSQYEYEDEYDDSFDDLGLSVGDVGFDESGVLMDRVRPNVLSEIEKSTTNASKSNTQKKLQFYVKDGKNYSYKITGSVAVSNRNEAAILSQAQRESIHGLGRGGNIPTGAVKNLLELSEDKNDDPEVTDAGERGNRGSGFRGRGGRNNYRKDQAFKKHMSSLGGY